MAEEKTAIIDAHRPILSSDGLTGLIENRRTHLGIPVPPAAGAPDVEKWMPWRQPGQMRELPPTLGADYAARRDALAWIYRAVCDNDTLEYKMDNKIMAALVAAAGESNGVTPDARDRLVKASGVLFGWLRDADLYWDKCGSLYTVWKDAVTPPANDLDRIHGNKLQALVDVFGPSVITYGQALYQEILAHPVAGGGPPDEFALQDAVNQVEARLVAGGGSPVIMALRAQLAAAPNPNVQKAAKLVGRQVFKNLGGASEANRQREAAERARREAAHIAQEPKGYLLKNISGVDPHSGIVAPLRFWHDNKGLYQGGKAFELYNYTTQRYSPGTGEDATMWGSMQKALTDAGVPIFGPGVRLWEKDTPPPAPIMGTRDVQVNIIGAGKREERNATVVETVKKVMDDVILGDTKAILAIPGALHFRWQGAPHNPAAPWGPGNPEFDEPLWKAVDFINMTDYALQLMMEGEEAKPVPVPYKVWLSYVTSLGRSYGFAWDRKYKDQSGREHKVVDQLQKVMKRYEDAERKAKGHTLLKDAGSALANMAAIGVTGKPVLK